MRHTQRDVETTRTERTHTAQSERHTHTHTRHKHSQRESPQRLSNATMLSDIITRVAPHCVNTEHPKDTVHAAYDATNSLFILLLGWHPTVSTPYKDTARGKAAYDATNTF